MGAGAGPHEATEEDAGREDEAKRRPDRRAVPAAVLGRLLYLVDDLDLTFFVLGDHRGVVSADDVFPV